MISSFLLRCEFQEKRESGWRKQVFNLNSRLRWGAQYLQTHRIHLLFSYKPLQLCKWFFELKIILFNFWLREFIKKQTQKVYTLANIYFCSLSNALCSSDKSVQIKNFKHHTFIGMCSLFTWSNLQIMNSVYKDTSSFK